MLDFIHLHRNSEDLYTSEFVTDFLPDDSDTPMQVTQSLFTTNLPGLHRALDAYATWVFEQGTEGEVGMFSLSIVQDIFSRYMQQCIKVLNYFLFPNVYFHIHGDIQDTEGQTYEDLTYDTRDNSRDMSDRNQRAYLYFLDNLLENLILESLKRKMPEELVWDTLCDDELLENLNRLYVGDMTAEEFEEKLEKELS